MCVCNPAPLSSVAPPGQPKTRLAPSSPHHAKAELTWRSDFDLLRHRRLVCQRHPVHPSPPGTGHGSEDWVGHSHLPFGLRDRNGTFLHSLSSTGTDVLGRRAGRGSTQPGPAHTDGSRATRPTFPLGGAGPRAVSVGPTVRAESAMRFCRLRAMHQPELLADEPRFVFWTVRRRVCNTGPRYADGQGRCGRRRG